jgi:predicted acetyltransferase
MTQNLGASGRPRFLRMTTLDSRLHLPSPITVSRCGGDDEPALDALWLCFRHDMSSITGELPDAGGRFRDSRLRSALTSPTWAAWILRAAHHPIGLAVARALDEPERVLSSFFIVSAARRAGRGHAFATAVLSEWPGRWAIAYQDANTGAAQFWPRVARALDPACVTEHHVVPGRPDLPPDAWVRLSITSHRT